MSQVPQQHARKHLVLQIVVSMTCRSNSIMGLPAGFSSFIYTPSSPVTAVSQSNASLVKCRFKFFWKNLKALVELAVHFQTRKNTNGL